MQLHVTLSEYANLVVHSVKWITLMQNASMFLGLPLCYFPISPESSVFIPGNRKGEVYVCGGGDEAGCGVLP
jgi:hypothetical protein